MHRNVSKVPAGGARKVRQLRIPVRSAYNSRLTRASYNGYYRSFPSYRRGFDSHRPLQTSNKKPPLEAAF